MEKKISELEKQNKNICDAIIENQIFVQEQLMTFLVYLVCQLNCL
jgi:hypothetical protein